jgi:uncharacterized protein involved in outer membrane biogenesis
MKPLRFRLRPARRCLIALGVLVLPAVFWTLVLAVIPTDCARAKIAARLSKASGRTVTLGAIRVGVLGGVSLRDLKIGVPRSGDDAWLQVKEASINVSMLQLLFGQVDPTEVNVHGLFLRILRRRNGTLELADLLQTGSDPKTTQSAESDGTHEPTGLTFRLDKAKVLVVDEPTGTRLEFTGVEGWGTCQGGLASLTELRGALNGGTFQLAAQVDRSGKEPRFEGQVRLRDVALREGMTALAYLVPVLADAPASVDGKLALDLYLRGEGASRDALRRSVVGQGKVTLDPIELDGSRLLAELSQLTDQPSQGRVGAIRSDVSIKDGRIVSDNLTLDVTKMPVMFSGWTDFDGQVSYRLRVEGLAGRLPAKAKDFLTDLAINLDDLADVKVRGTIHDLAVTVEGVRLDANGSGGEPGSKDGSDDRQPLREIGRRLRDRLRR